MMYYNERLEGRLRICKDDTCIFFVVYVGGICNITSSSLVFENVDYDHIILK